MKIKLKSDIINDDYTNYVYEAVDIQNQEETVTEVSFDLSEGKSFDWNIGVILGSSGSGKSTILKKMGALKETIFDKEKQDELNKAIEFNGSYWHYDRSNPNCKPKGYHGMKSKLCRDKNIKLLHIREDLWYHDSEKMKKIILKFLK